MQPNRIGRVLGISARVAADKLREKAAQGSGPTVRSNPPQAPRSAPAAPRVAAPAATRTVATSAAKAAEGSRRLARGAGRFGASLFRPFAHATGVLALQITGVFFAMFTMFFVEHSWQIYRTRGLHDPHLPVYAGFALLFGWFTVTSFWRARRKQRS